jgi:hypothetical protein
MGGFMAKVKMVVDAESMETVLEYLLLNLEEELSFVPKEKAEGLRRAIKTVRRAYLSGEVVE